MSPKSSRVKPTAAVTPPRPASVANTKVNRAARTPRLRTTVADGTATSRPSTRVWLTDESKQTRKAAAQALAQEHGLTVKRVDLNRLVSKFIGETEKNLGQLFDRAEEKQWLLFFDEANALFDQRTTVKDAHDRYANQLTNYLLQRIEQSGTPVMFTSNRAIAPSFKRRLRAFIQTTRTSDSDDPDS